MLFVVWISFVVYASLVPVDLQGIEFVMMDKLVHFAIHAATVGLASLAFPTARAFSLSLVGLALLGPMIEMMQAFTPDRTASVADQLANTLGFLSGWALARYLRGPTELEPAPEQAEAN